MNDPKHHKDANPDPITGSPGSHPVGVGVGAAAAGATGAAIGTAVGGPIGTAVGAAIGAVAGGLVGKGVAEMIDPTAEEAYWREQHRNQPYGSHREYDEYVSAYRTGYEGYGRHYKEGATFEDTEPVLRQDYETATGSPVAGSQTGNAGARASLRWDEARQAAKAAWDRVHENVNRQRM